MCRVLLGRKQDPTTFTNKLNDGFDSKEYVGREDANPDGKVDLNFHAIVIRSVDQILPYCVISAEYPEAVKIGDRQLTNKQLKSYGSTAKGK